MFFNDGVPVPCPLVTLFGASNELPDGRDLEALFDRFAVRFHVPYLLRETSMKAMLRAPDPVPSISLDMAASEQAHVGGGEGQGHRCNRRRADLYPRGVSGGGDHSFRPPVEAVAQAGPGVRLSRRGDADRPRGPGHPHRLALARAQGPPQGRPYRWQTAPDPVVAQATEVLDAARETAQKVASLQAGDRKAYIAQAAQAIDAFGQQQRRLTDLAKSAGKRAKATIADATADISVMHGELARAVSAGLGLGVTR